jgi:hypothetical protein
VADDFPLLLKGTIDKLVSDKVTALRGTHPTLQWAEVDDMLQTDAVFKGEQPAILWQFGSVYPDPRAPLYGVEFTVGAKTTADPGNYLLIDLVAQIRDVFVPGVAFQLFDYVREQGAPSDTLSKGYLRVVANEISPQQFDRQSGIRYAVIRGKAVHHG